MQRLGCRVVYEGPGIAVEVVLVDLAGGGEDDADEYGARGLVFFGTGAARSCVRSAPGQCCSCPRGEISDQFTGRSVRPDIVTTDAGSSSGANSTL
jgi:hypothetical protein